MEEEENAGGPGMIPKGSVAIWERETRALTPLPKGKEAEKTQEAWRGMEEGSKKTAGKRNGKDFVHAAEKIGAAIRRRKKKGGGGFPIEGGEKGPPA